MEKKVTYGVYWVPYSTHRKITNVASPIIVHSLNKIPKKRDYMVKSNSVQNQSPKNKFNHETTKLLEKITQNNSIFINKKNK